MVREIKLYLGCAAPKGVYATTNFTFNYNLIIPVRDEIKFRFVLRFLALKKDNKTFLPLFVINFKGKFENKLDLSGLLGAAPTV